MRLIIAHDYEELSQRAADIVNDVVRQKPDAVLVLPTGYTPLLMYALLVKPRGRGTVDFACTRIVQLDEYVGIGRDDPRNLLGWLDRVFLSPAGIQAKNVLSFDSTAADPDAEARRMEFALRELGAIDLAVLGLGPNGHLGFNEPGSAFDSSDRAIDLSPESIRSNARYWGGLEFVPRKALTLGLATLATARRALLLVTGPEKEQALSALLHGALGPEVPATCLRLMQDVTVITATRVL
jgi:glucosamine-6-phosphate deaminase